MPDSQIYTNQAAVKKAAGTITALALSKLRFCGTEIMLSRFTSKVQLVAAEATFDGYTAGGYTLTAWTGPISDSGGGAIATSPLTNVVYGTPEDPPVGNMLYAWWVEDAAGVVRIAGTFDPPRPVQEAGDGFPFVIQIVEARNPTVEF